MEVQENMKNSKRLEQKMKKKQNSTYKIFDNPDLTIFIT